VFKSVLQVLLIGHLHQNNWLTLLGNRPLLGKSSDLWNLHARRASFERDGADPRKKSPKFGRSIDPEFGWANSGMIRRATGSRWSSWASGIALADRGPHTGTMGENMGVFCGDTLLSANGRHSSVSVKSDSLH
jgi:hypothetical protein